VNRSHTYAQNLVHVVFSTKERRKLIPLDRRTKLWAFMTGVCSKEKILPHEIGGMDDHAHLLIQLPPTWSLPDAVQEIKTSSSRWMGKSFAWQRGFAAFSVSASNKDTVVRYICTQDDHHKKMDCSMSGSSVVRIVFRQNNQPPAKSAKIKKRSRPGA